MGGNGFLKNLMYITTIQEILLRNWGNRNEAWVTSGAFKDGASNYNTWLKMITYDKPF